MKVSIIIPIYGVEKFIGRCAESLMSQTLQDIEYIFIDDASPDKSIEILKSVLSKYPNRQSQVRIIEHQQNKGLPEARNTGLAQVTGEYIFHCDSDDFMEPDALEIMYQTAIQQNADIVWCDFYLSYPNNERYMKQPDYSSPLKALKAMMCGTMKYNVWNKLVKRSLYTQNKIEFPAGYNMAEDMTMILLFTHASKTAYIPKALYHYVKWNTASITNDYTETKLQSLRYNVNRATDYITQRCGDTIKPYAAFFKLETKWPFLISDKKIMYNKWDEWYSEANKYIWQNKGVCFRIRFIEWCASKKQYWIVWLHYQIVIRFLYSIMYK